ncbi:MAG: hypothetical protein R2800_10045 [Flavipsychrobacter sp.]
MKQENTEISAKDAIRERFIEAIEYLLSNNSALKKGDIALSIDIKPQNLTEILGRRMYVQSEMIQKICDVYNVSPFFIFFNTKPIVESFKEYINTNKQLYNSNNEGISYKEYMSLSDTNEHYHSKPTKKEGSTATIINLMDALKEEMITLSKKVENAEKGAKK